MSLKACDNFGFILSKHSSVSYDKNVSVLKGTFKLPISHTLK